MFQVLKIPREKVGCGRRHGMGRGHRKPLGEADGWQRVGFRAELSSGTLATPRIEP